MPTFKPNFKISPAKKTLWADGGYSKVYPRLENFTPKEKLNKEIADLICEFAKQEGLSEGEITVAEVGAGPAPISRLLVEKGISCKAFDVNPNMSIGDEIFDYDRDFDLLSHEVLDEDKGKYDFVVMVNVWYATTLPPKGTKKYTEEEAQVLRITSLKKAGSLLKPGGYFVLSDPLKANENLGWKRILDILDFDKKARLQLKGEDTTIHRIALEYIKDPKMLKILRINRDIMKNSVLLTDDGLEDIIKSVGLFERKVYENPKDYLGTNMTVVLRRNGFKCTSVNPPVLMAPVLLQGKAHENILSKIGQFRRKAYAQAGATESLPEVDKYDLKSGVVALYLDENSFDIAAVATLQPCADVGLEIEELMKPEDGDFYEQLSIKVADKVPFVKGLLDSGKDINYAEIRRLAAIDLDLKELKKLLSSLDLIFREYCVSNDVDVVLFISDPKRFRMFNLFKRGEKFAKVDGFFLNRGNETAQTVLLYGADYFFKDWKELLNDDEALLFDELRKLLKNDVNWKTAIKNHPKEEYFRKVAWKVLSEAEDNVSLYFVAIESS